jgi:hypothetical protein
MSRKTAVLSYGLHPPWNMGEAVLARNFARLLMRLYDDISVLSTIDERRGTLEDLNAGVHELKIKYFHSENELKSAIEGLDHLSQRALFF